MFSTWLGGLILGLVIGGVGMFFIYSNNRKKFGNLADEIEELKDKLKK